MNMSEEAGLFFTRLEQQVDGAKAPSLYLGPASKLISYEGNRPISMVWELQYPMPALYKSLL